MPPNVTDTYHYKCALCFTTAKRCCAEHEWVNDKANVDVRLGVAVMLLYVDMYCGGAGDMLPERLLAGAEAEAG